MLRLVVASLQVVPARWCWWMGGVLGYCWALFPLRDQRRCRAHLRRAFPAADEAWITDQTRRCFRGVGRMILWTLNTMRRPLPSLRRRMPLEGARHLAATRAAARRGAGTLIVSGHLGNWELLARITGSVAPVTVLGKRLRDADQDRFIRELRGIGGNRVLYQDDGVRACLRELRDGRLMATLPDQDVGRLAGAFVPFFGEPAYTPTGPALLAMLARCPVQSVFCFERAGRWVWHWGPRWHPPRSGDRDRDAALATARIMAYQEALMRRIGSWQWAWWHKRWRHRPADKPEALVVEPPIP